ncbi:MAG: putative hemolysin [Candidatus Binatia bacterium]|jgi:putative hemolysin
MHGGFEALFILVLILFNGVNAMAEIAIVSSRKNRLKKLADEGDVRAKIALQLANSPTRFLSTVQVGITLIGILAGAMGGATLAKKFAPVLEQVPVLAPYAGGLAVVLVVAAITFLSLVFGELVPKRIGMNQPEEIAMKLARPMNCLSRLTGPAVTVLSWTTEGILKLLGVKRGNEAPVSEDDIRMMMMQGLHAGVFHRTEKELIEGAFRLDELLVRDIMTPRTRVVWLDVDDSNDVNWRKIVSSGHTYFPVIQGDRDKVKGIVSVKALWANMALTDTCEIKNLLTKALVVPASMTATDLLETFRSAGIHNALVTNEYGGTSGMVTLNDVLESVVGALPSREQPQQAKMRQRADGSWNCDALLPIHELKKLLGQGKLPGEDEARFQTLSGLILHRFGRIPDEGESFEIGEFTIEVFDMDNHRIDKVIITRKGTAAGVA